jgi:multiple sugar transport system substrate-binding protein
MEWMTRPDGWWASQFFARGFGWLAYGRAERYITNPLQKALIPLSEQMRVIGPDVAMKCPDVMLSEAEDTVSDNQPIANNELINDYLQNGGDWFAMAKELDDAKDEIFLATLEEERAAGLDVAPECWANPDWDPTTNFDWSVYFED